MCIHPLPRIVGCGYLGTLPLDITLLGAQNIDCVGLMNMVIIKWPCQVHSQTNIGGGLHDP